MVPCPVFALVCFLGLFSVPIIVFHKIDKENSYNVEPKMIQFRKIPEKCWPVGRNESIFV
jgi:hypothetical protein